MVTLQCVLCVCVCVCRDSIKVYTPRSWKNVITNENHPIRTVCVCVHVVCVTFYFHVMFF